MTLRSLIGLLALGLLLPTLTSSLFWHDTVHGSTQPTHPGLAIPLPHASIMDLANAFTLEERTQDTASQPYDSRPCAQQPSPGHCNGVLPIIPHFSPDSRDAGNGYCFDHQPQIMEDQQIPDAMGQTMVDFQLWYFTGCKSYAAHLIATPGANGQQPTLQLQVDQYTGSGILNGITQLFWHVGGEDKLFPSATQAIGPLQDHEIRSPMLYSPDAPVQATTTLQVNNQPYVAFSSYYAAGHPTTINGQSS
ncbi:hypothetical protein KSD_00840 [Ktedonobacter sp. SOSP1-85]|uniref:hypothetical protein n=1 Tax=Ktedonobacter sp. SOSP1-85 TaxID=2778367 RepID=UPI0019168A48|nr:hypothetical protein [Ktedonobacter sp. SOSP1-85]GHO72313.1 hypothetical protein KSD_00840 [Ktedonobacter sp. SOSP1-85]